MSAAGGVHTSRYELHVLLEAPELERKTNLEQDFTLLANAELQPIGDDDDDDDRRFAVGAIVQPNPIRVGSGNVANGKMVLDKTLNVHAVAVQSRLHASQATVPVMLHDKPAVITITATEQSTGQKKWCCRFPYDLKKEGLFPVRRSLCGADVASTWEIQQVAQTADAPDELHSNLSLEAMVAERIKFGVDRTVHVVAEDMQLFLTVRAAVNEATGEPLSYFVSRCWSLNKIALVAPAARFGVI